MTNGGMIHYLVTGGAGFIGSHLCEALLAAGHHVCVVDDLSTGRRENLPEAAELIVGDAGDDATIRPLIAQADGVFHLAAVASVERSRQAWRATHLANQTATITVLEAIARRAGGVIPLVYASSAAIYGDPPADALPLREDTPAHPLTPYGADKLGSELHARVAREGGGIPTLGLRFFNVFGPRQDPSSPYSGVISIFCERLAKGAPITLFGDGEQTRDFIYVRDVVAHLMAAMQQLECGAMPEQAVLNVCTGQAVSVRQLAGTIARLCGAALQVNEAPARAGDIRHSLGSPERARQCLGVQAAVPLDDGLKKTLEWVDAMGATGT